MNVSGPAAKGRSGGFAGKRLALGFLEAAHCQGLSSSEDTFRGCAEVASLDAEALHVTMHPPSECI